MTCDLEQLHCFHDDELSLVRREAVQLHLKTCAACRAELATLRSLSRRIEEAAIEPMPARLVGSILAARRVEAGRAVLRISSWMTAVAATVLVGALLFGPGENENATEVATTSPSPLDNINAVQASNWETAAVLPPTESRAESNSEIALVAQWMSDGLSSSGR